MAGTAELLDAGPSALGGERWWSLLQITSALAEAVGDEAVYEAIVDHTARALGAASCALWLRDGQLLRLVRHVGAPPPSVAMLDGEPRLAAAATPGRKHRVSCLPLVADGVALGTLGLTFDEEQEASDSERDFLRLVARYATQALRRLDLQLEAEEARRRAEQLYRFANEAVSAQTLEHVFEAALDAIIEALRASRASILLLDDDGVMRFRAWRGLSDAYRAAMDGYSPWQVDDAPEPIVVGDCLHAPAWSSSEAAFRAEGVAALAFIPLVSRGRLLGRFMVYYEQPHELTPSEVKLARALANHLASLIVRFRAVADLERSVRDNQLFAGVLAHDLRNPLGAITSAAHVALLQDESADERIKRPLGRILSSAGRMSNMIAQLLDFTRARVGGRIAIRPTQASLLDVAKQVIAELELVHADRTLAVTAHADPYGVWDPDRLLQVVSNLVGNACEHGTPRGHVVVEIDGRAPSVVTLAVRNDGVIPPAVRPHLFEPFGGRERRTGDSRGLGLGLYIVREIVRAHRGTIDVSSSEGEGTCFVVRLPRATSG